MATHNQTWHSEDTTGGIAYGNPSLTNIIKENQERNQVFVRLATNVNVLTKMFTESQTKKVNVMEDVQPTSNEDNEEAYYVNNYEGGYQRQPYQGSGQQNQWRPKPQGRGNQQWQNGQGNWSKNDNNFSNRCLNPYVPQKGQYSNSPHRKEDSSSYSKLENMFERVLENQKRCDTSMRNMTELVVYHAASIQNLETKMRDLSRVKNLKKQGTLPSDIIANQKCSRSSPTSHCMEIATRSGKIHQGKNEQVDEVEDSEQEVEAQVEVPIVFESVMVLEEVKIQEVNREQVEENVKGTPKSLTSIPRTPPPFPQRLDRKMPDFAKYLKDLITNKRITKNEVVNVTHRVSSIFATTAVQKKEDPGAFTISCTIGVRDIARSLCKSRARINLLPLDIYKQAWLGMPRPRSMRLQIVNHSIKRRMGIVDDVLVKVGKFLLPPDFVILDCVIDKEIPIILWRPFLATGRALMDSKRNEIKF
ncbi:PREDICTED: uncharacterized protein LOC109238605 [Nicotiana attenuata]|uniref:uncharacterized protein LOC109238605 n=1 Tax=Nicotiana attenuata TaxID=49451 RepID=UPI000905511C|nr:PREDICTED: uncharacterized protein LOC109238605 [Nicotiana attenuata]